MGIIYLSTCILGLFITLTIHFNLNKYINIFSSTFTEQGDNQELLAMQRRKMAIRSFLYSLSACVTLTFQPILHIFVTFGTFIIQLTIAKNIALRLSELLTGTTFAINPLLIMYLDQLIIKLKTEDIQRNIIIIAKSKTRIKFL
jgi:hypothetical protein